MPPPIELVEGYGVFITRRALDDAVDSCRQTATRLMRNLVGVFFWDDILSRSNACGGGKKDHIALDQDVLGACYSELSYCKYCGYLLFYGVCSQ